MTPGGDRQAPASRLAALDGMRGLAALAVVVYHVWLYSMPEPRLSNRDAGWEFVIGELRLAPVLFFVLSGYLIYGPWVRAALDRLPGPQLGGYLLRRGARILPAYYLALVGSIALLWGAGATPGVRLPPAEDLWTFGIFAQNFSDATVMKLNAPMWTLAVEVCFYLALPLIGAIALRLPARRTAQALVPLALLVGAVLWNRHLANVRADMPLWVSKTLLTMLPYFAVGMLTAALLHGRRLQRSATFALLGVGAALVVGDAWWHGHAAWSGLQGTDVWALTMWRDLPAALGFGALVAVGGHAMSERRVLGARPVAWLGTVSYGLYLWHVPLMLWLRRNGLLPMNDIAALAVVVPLSYAAAAASWHWIEAPAIAWSRRRGGRRRDQSSVSAGSGAAARARA